MTSLADLEAAVKAEQTSWPEGASATFTIGKLELMCLIASVQLATRHPGWAPHRPARVVAEEVVRLMAADAFKNDPACLAVIALGWDKRYDVADSDPVAKGLE